ncbi:MAG: hypothetical protein KJZ78_12220 [Bryobacteraceae bacterium]|nr:hypothetical protein [Bryobacteraceae bacterium]
MPELKRVGSLDIEQNPKFTEQDWRFQRIGMAGMLVVTVLALAGVTGSGPLSSTAAASGTLRVNYNRFCHRDAPARITVETNMPANGSPLQIWLDARVVDTFRIDQITPEPASVTHSGQRLVFAFAASGPGRVRLDFSLTPRTYGLVETRLGELNGPEISIRQLLYF